jgi:hypothetical protein
LPRRYVATSDRNRHGDANRGDDANAPEDLVSPHLLDVGDGSRLSPPMENFALPRKHLLVGTGGRWLESIRSD